MKKVLLCILLSLVTLGLYGQNDKTRSKSDVDVQAHFKTDQMQTLPEVSVQPVKSPICCFLKEELEYPELSAEIYDEGEVVVELTISNKGNIADMQIVNSVSDRLDKLVINCLAQTDGKWDPAYDNGIPTESTRRIHVIFDVLGNDSHQEIACDYYKSGLKHLRQGEMLEENPFLTKDKKERKSQREYRYALNDFNKATVYTAEEPSIIFMQTKTYEKLGDMTMKESKLQEYENMFTKKEHTFDLYVTIAPK